MSDRLYGVFETLKNKDKFRKVFIDVIGNIAWDIDSSIHWNIGMTKDIEYSGKTLKLQIKNTVSDYMFVEDLIGNKAVEQTIGIVVDVK